MCSSKDFHFHAKSKSYKHERRHLPEPGSVPFPSFGGRAWETSCDIILFFVVVDLICVAVGVVGCCCSSPRGHTCTLGCSLFTTHVDGSNAGGGISEMVAPCLLDLPSKSLSANLEELSSPDPDPVGAAGFEKNSSGVGQAAAVAQMASNQKSQHLPFI